MKNFIYGDFESKFERCVFKKIPGKAPELIFYTQAGKEVERLNIEKFSREDLNALISAKGIPRKSAPSGNGHEDEF